MRLDHPISPWSPTIRGPIKVRFRRPWVRIGLREAGGLEVEFDTERSLLHELATVGFRAWAKNTASSEVLFRIHSHLCDFAVVSLTGSGAVEMRPGCPKYELYVDWEDFKERRLIPDSTGFAQGGEA